MSTNNPFAVATTNATQQTALASAEQNRAISEVHAAVMLARANPRNQIAAMDRILNACTRKTLAETALYSYTRGGSEVSGPSIRLAECIAQQWGNIQFGFSELSRGVDHDGVTYSEVGAYAWDLESNTRRPLQFRVRHWRDTKKGGYPIKEERDISELIANQAQRRVRSCILAIIPGDVTEAAVQQCEVTLKASADTSPEAVKKIIEAFASFGVVKEQIEKRIQRRMDAILPAQVIALKKIYASLRDGASVSSDWFEPLQDQTDSSAANELIGGKKAKDSQPEQQTLVDESTVEIIDIAPWKLKVDDCMKESELSKLLTQMPDEVRNHPDMQFYVAELRKDYKRNAGAA